MSPVTCQILSDITGRVVETVESSQDVGAVGAAMLAAVGKGMLPDMSAIRDIIPVKHRYEPDMERKKIYDRNYEVYKRLYKYNKKSFAMLNVYDREAC